MSDFDRIPALLAAIGEETLGHSTDELRQPFARLTFYDDGGVKVTISRADPDEFQEQGGFSDDLMVLHCTDIDDTPFALITLRGSATDPIALLKRALDFVRTETPVPL